MINSQPAPTNLNKTRIEWVDFSKGVCIILVVLMHSTLGVEKALGEVSFLHGFIEWARPFRMPDFFLIAGLFLSRRIGHTWRSYLDTKVVHFFYFYFIWMTIWYVLKLPEFITTKGPVDAMLLYPISFVQPLGTLWFIYLLPVFFVFTKLTRNVPVIAIWLFAAVLHASQLETGARVIDEFGARFIFFYSGYAFAPFAFRVAEFFNQQKLASLINGLLIWAVLNAWLVTGGYAKTAGIELAMGYVGTGAVFAIGVLLSRVKFGEAVAYCGRNSIVIFLSYFVFMAAARMIIIKTGIDIGPGLLSLIVTATAIIGPLILSHLIKATPLTYLYRRHKFFYLPQETEPQKMRAKTLVKKISVDERQKPRFNTGNEHHPMA